MFSLVRNRVTAVDGQYQIGVYTVRPIGYGEEVTFDYNSVTEVSGVYSRAAIMPYQKYSYLLYRVFLSYVTIVVDASLISALE